MAIATPFAEVNTQFTYCTPVYNTIIIVPSIILYTTNTLKLNVLRNFSSREIDRMPTMADTITPRMKGKLISEGLAPESSKTPAPNITGVDNKKENLAASSLVKENHLAAVMVMPARETPGINAKAWAVPIKIASPKVILSRRLICCLLSTR